MQTHSSPVEIDQVQIWRIQTARAIMRISTAAAAVLLAVLVGLWIIVPQFSLRGMVLAMPLVFLVFSVAGLLLLRRQQPTLAIAIYVPGLVSGLLGAIYLLGGVTGPVISGLVAAGVVVGLIGGARSLRYFSFAMGVAYLTLAVLEITQTLQPLRVPDNVSWILEISLFLNALVVTTFVMGVFIRQTERAAAAERQRSLELAEASRQAEELALAEREARERERRAALHIRETVAGYVDYLSLVASGEYTARVDVGELDEDVEGDRELHALGEYLNATVDTLVVALTQSQEVQRRYAEQTWQTALETGRVQPEFAYRQNQIAPQAEWLPQMQQAVVSGALVADGENAAAPLVINRQVVGALGGQRPDGRPWTAEELALIEDVTGQLAQTIESLRLFDETQRRAARERVLREVTARVRSSTDPETVLKSLVREVGAVLNRATFVRLIAPEDSALQTPDARESDRDVAAIGSEGGL